MFNFKALSSVGFLHLADGKFYKEKTIFNEDVFVYSTDFVVIFDNVVKNNDIKEATKAQEELIQKYFIEADGVMSKEIQDLDKFLGSYVESESDKLVRDSIVETDKSVKSGVMRNEWNIFCK